MRGKLKRKFAVVMASVLALSNIQSIPVFAGGGGGREKTILRFEELPEKYAIQELELGAAEEDIRFPGSLWADMVIVKQKNEGSKAEETEAGKTEVGKAETEASVEAEESSGADSTTEQQAGDADLSVSAEEEKALPEDEEEASSDESSNDGTVNEPETTGSDTTGTAEPEEEEEPEIKQPEVKQPESDTGEADSPDNGLESEKPAKEENDAGKPSGNLQEDSENTEEPKAPVATGSEAEKTEKDNESDDRIEKTVRRKIRDIEWELNFTESSDSEIQAEVPGTYVYEPVIPSGYEIDLEVELPQILVKVGGVDAEEKPCTKTEGCTLPDGHEGGCVTEPPTDAPSACTCETACAEGAVDKSCPVCAAADADLADCTGMLVPQAAQQAAGTPYIVSNLDELNNACAEANPGDTILFRDWTSREPAYSGFSSGVHVIFESYSERGIIWVQNGNLASVRVEQQDWLITLEGSSHVEDVILEAGRFELYSGTVENVKMTGGRFIQDGGTAVTGAFVYEGGSFNSIYLGENGTFQNLSGAPVDADINGAQVTVAYGSTVDKNGTVMDGNLITGDGYSFDPADGKLTITANSGSFYWKEDGKIEKDALLTVEVQSGVTTLIANAFRGCVNLTSVTLPSSLTVIEGSTFEGCTSLTHIDLPDKLEHIMLGAFGESGLTEITIPASVTKLFGWVFYACPDLKTVIFEGTTAPELPGNDMNSIFAGMASPPTVYVPDGATGYDKLGVPVYPDGITPAIKTHPQSRTVTVGEAVSFTVATEKAVPFFQWQVSKNGGSTWEDVTDARSATYDIEKAGGVMNGWQYRCKASSKDGEAVSNAAELTVTAQWSNNTPSGGGGGGSYTAPDPKNSYTVTGDRISQSISRYDLQWMINSGKSLTLSCDKASMTFEQAALKTILEAVPAMAGNITFAASPADISAFPDAAALIGSRPVYDFTISYKDGSGKDVLVTVNFPVGSAAVTLNYTPAAGEVTGSLFMVYVDEKGTVTWLDKSSYNSGKVLADASHFSVYGVAYKASAPVFTDITNHWAKADIEFVAARNLLTGMGNSQFSPDAAMTRGMFVTALGRLAGISPDSYKTRSFTDITANAYYASYAEWAVQNGIVKGTDEGVFSPDEPVTREQMAVMMAGYAGQMGYSIPAPLAEAAFTDNASISAWAAKEVKAMQRAGIIKGKDGNRFAPQEGATRAEVSAVLHRFVGIVIDLATAQGWTMNDSGHWLYYKDGQKLTGWQTIGKLRYYFNDDGVMHEGWKEDSTGKWYYWTNARAAIGWREIGEKWYYFYENGAMAVNTIIDGYEVGLDGARK